MNDGVLTTKDFLYKNSVEKKKKEVSPHKKDVIVKYQYRFDPAPMGKAKTVINFEEKKMTLEIIDKIYIPPKNWSISKQEKFKKIIINVYGFKDASFVDSVKKEEKQEEKKLEYHLGHPDNSPDERINGELTIKIGRKNHKFKCENGIVKTDNIKIYEELLKKGWYQADIKELK